MHRLLVIKTSSMGDIIHALPILKDLRMYYPQLSIDWVAEESFASIPRLHSDVQTVIPVALRRWRKAWWTSSVRKEMRAFKHAIRTSSYDAVIDLQGLIKSAWIAKLSRAHPIHGYAWGSLKENIASLSYDVKHAVAWQASAVARNRLLMASALGYKLTEQALERADFGLDTSVIAARCTLDLPARFVAVMPSASRVQKLWPEDDWVTVLSFLKRRGYQACFFAGTLDEQARAERLALRVEGFALPKMSLELTATVIARASLFIGLDSGLTHLAGALAKPTIGIYCDHDPQLAPVMSQRFAQGLGGKGTPPACHEVLAALECALNHVEP